LPAVGYDRFAEAIRRALRRCVRIVSDFGWIMGRVLGA